MICGKDEEEDDTQRMKQNIYVDLQTKPDSSGTRRDSIWP